MNVIVVAAFIFVVGSGGVAVVVCETVLLYYRGCVTVDAVSIVVVVG